MLGGATTGVVALAAQPDAAPLVVRCAAALDGTSWYLDPDQADNAALLAATALRRGLPARAVTIALATALQESKLRNIDHGDRDSVGIFQQRPSQGWGTVEQMMDPVYATNAFYDALVKVPGYQDLPVTEAAQAVQRSAFPDAYAQHEARARAWASALTGYSPGAVTCTLRHGRRRVTADAVVARVARDLGIPATAGRLAGHRWTSTSLPGGATDARRAWPGRWPSGRWPWPHRSGSPTVQVGDSTWTRADGDVVHRRAAQVPGRSGSVLVLAGVSGR